MLFLIVSIILGMLYSEEVRMWAQLVFISIGKPYFKRSLP